MKSLIFKSKDGQKELKVTNQQLLKVAKKEIKNIDEYALKSTIYVCGDNETNLPRIRNVGIYTTEIDTFAGKAKYNSFGFEFEICYEDKFGGVEWTWIAFQDGIDN